MMNLAEKLLKFHFFYKGFVAYIVANATDLLISHEQVTLLSANWADWEIKFKAYTTPDTYGSVSISDINDAYETYAPRAETIRIQIRDNSDIVLSGAAKINLGIKPSDKKPSKILPPDFAPSVALVSVGDLSVDLYVMDPNHPSKKAKPKGARFIGSMVAFTGSDAPPPALDAYTTRVPEGKTNFSILYSSDKIGKKMWIICYYMSPTGKPSPLSAPLGVVMT